MTPRVWMLGLSMGWAVMSAAPAADSAPASAASSAATAGSAPARRAVVAVLPLAVDFTESGGTDEDYGQRVAFAIARKWASLAGWEALDRFTVEEALAAARLPRGADPDGRALAEMVRGKLAADVAVVGAASGDGPAKTLRIRVVDYRGAAGVWPGETILDKTFKLAYWTDLRFVLEEAIASATGQTFSHPGEQLAILDPPSVSAWQDNPNLVANPSFAEGAAGRLAGWEGVIESHRYRPPWVETPKAPLQEDRTRMILWSPPPEGGAGRVLQLAMPESVAAMHGLACYSDWIAVVPGHRYRCQITYASDGPTFLPFVKGYALFESAAEGASQRREVYRRQFPKLPATGGAWRTATVDFVPSVLPPSGGHRQPYRLEWVRVDLYCYWPKGHVWVRDVALKLVEEAPPGGSVADPMARTPGTTSAPAAGAPAAPAPS